MIFVIIVLMATYTILQDVEAEDKLIGPLSFKQFIYALIAGAFGAGVIFGFRLTPILGILCVPPTLLFLVLAFYNKAGQPSEVYLLGLIVLLFKPRVRVWSRDGLAEHIDIEVPKKIAKNYTDGRNRTQVRNQLNQLAQLVDSRGWSSRHVGNRSSMNYGDANDDRLVQSNNLPSNSPDIVEVDDRDDVYSPVSTSSGVSEQKIQEITNQTKAQAIINMHQALQNPQQATPSEPATPSSNAEAIARLAKENNLSVSQLAEQAKRLDNK